MNWIAGIAIAEYLLGMAVTLEYIESLAFKKGKEELDRVDYCVIATWPISMLAGMIIGRLGGGTGD